MTAAFCVFNRTRESFLCLCALEALGISSPDVLRVSRELSQRHVRPGREDGVWLTRPQGVYAVGRDFPVDRVYLDRGNRVVQLIEHLDPLQIVRVHRRYASVLEVRIRTIFSSRTRVGDELLICFPEQVQTRWEEVPEKRAGCQERTPEEVTPCSKG
jgi:hypothetical protein